MFFQSGVESEYLDSIYLSRNSAMYLLIPLSFLLQQIDSIYKAHEPFLMSYAYPLDA